MLRAAALVPETVLLVPGAAGRAHVLDAERAAAVEAVARVVHAEPARLVVVAPGRRATSYTGPLVPSLAAAGLAQDALGWPVGPSPHAAASPTPLTEVAAALGVLLVQRAGWTGDVEVLIAAGEDARALRGRGAGLAQDDVGLVVVGSLSARHGPDAPLPDDPEAAEVDATLLADLARGAAGLRRAADLPAGRAAALAIGAWAPLQVLAGAAGVHDDVTVAAGPDGAQPDPAPAGVLLAEVLHASVVQGACHAVATWVRT